MATFSKGVTTFAITATGKRKIAQAERAIARGVRSGLRLVAEDFKRLLIKYSPTARQEAELLSAGEVTGGRSATSGTVGIPGGGRFLRISPQQSLREAIRESPITLTEGENRLFVTTCRMAELNQRTGFSWRTRKRGIQSTRPFDWRYMQALEDGGVWVVDPRTQALLNPQPGVLVTQVTKTIRPFGMFRRARTEIRTKAKVTIKAEVLRELAALKGS